MPKPTDKSEKGYYAVQSTFEEAMLQNGQGSAVSRGLQTLFTENVDRTFFWSHRRGYSWVVFVGEIVLLSNIMGEYSG
jgi:hypothetical protein